MPLRRIKSAPDPEQSDVVKILSGRPIPAFLFEFVMKKRILNVAAIRKLSLGNTLEASQLSCLSTITQHCRKQEQELQAIVLENNIRFEESRRTAVQPQLTRRATIGPIGETHSTSTMSLDSISEDREPDYDSQSSDMVEPHGSNNMLDFEGPLDFLRGDYDQEDIFARMF